MLALDASSGPACLALLADGRVLSEAEFERAGAETTAEQVSALLGRSQLSVGCLDGVVVGTGPGSFMGTRGAVGFAIGLAYGAGIRIWPISSLALWGARVVVPGQVAVACDAGRQQVYWSLTSAEDRSQGRLARHLLSGAAQLGGLLPGSVVIAAALNPASAASLRRGLRGEQRQLEGAEMRSLGQAVGRLWGRFQPEFAARYDMVKPQYGQGFLVDA